MKGHKHGHHHKHKRDGGGRINMKVSGNPDVFRETEEHESGDTEKKRGGRVKKHVHAEGKMAKHRRDRARGGKMMHEHKHRAKGGGVRTGADKSPWSTAHMDGHKSPEYPKETSGEVNEGA